MIKKQLEIVCACLNEKETTIKSLKQLNENSQLALNNLM